jgi:hypothetical protein
VKCFTPPIVFLIGEFTVLMVVQSIAAQRNSRSRNIHDRILESIF